MKLTTILTKERASRLLIAVLLTAGVLCPLLMMFGLDKRVVPSLLLAFAALAALVYLSAGKLTRWLLIGGLALFSAFQFFLPHAGFFGDCVEAGKSLILYLSGVTVAMSLFGREVALLLSIVVALLCFFFSNRGAGFVPASILTVLTLFGLWSLGRASLLWYTIPAFVALLLLVAQSTNERIDVFTVSPVALAVVLLAFLLLPSGRVTIAPLEKAASELKQTITDYLFFTEARNVFTLRSYGYAPKGTGILGGEATPSEYPVMTVKTDKRTLLRAVSMDRYTGYSFSDTSSAKRYLFINPRWRSLRDNVFLESLPAEAIRRASPLMNEKAVSIQMQNNAASTLFVPAFLRDLNTQSDMVPYFNDAGEIFITRDLMLNDHYTAFAPIVEGGDAGLDALIDASAAADDPHYASLYATYTQLPDHMEGRVFDDVGDIVASASTPYERALAIQRHLRRYYRYTLEPEDIPSNMDFVTYFLYVSEEGYCTYFASAMTVMCRMAGLPARYVEGFLATPGADGFAYVSGKDAHAWTEVYFKGFGWVPFDATPIRQQSGASQNTPPSDPSPSPSPTPSPTPGNEPTPSLEPELPDEEPTPTPSDDPSPDPSDEPSPAPSDDPTPEPEMPPLDNTDDDPDDSNDPDRPHDPPMALWWLLPLLALLLALALRVWLRMPDRVAARQKTDQERLFVYGSAVYTMALICKRPRKPSETPLRYARRLDRVKAFATPMTPLWRTLTLSNYSPVPPGPEQVRLAKDTCAQFLKRLSPLRKLRFLLSAAFGKACYRSLDTALQHETPKRTTALRIPSKGVRRTQAARPPKRSK